MDNEICEVVKEFVMFVEGLSHGVKGRIAKCTDRISGDVLFHWDISHYYGKQGAAGTYRPSHTSDPKFETVEFLLLGYMKGMTAECIIEPNEYY